MKTNLTIILVIVSVVLAGALFLTRHSDNVQMASDAASIVDYSNRLDTAVMQISERNGTLVILSNTLTQTMQASQTLSNQLTAVRVTLAQNTEQIGKLNQQVTATTAENQSLNQQVMTLSNQMTGLSGQIDQTRANLTRTNQDLVQLHQDYMLLDNRFRRDVAERVVVERKFNTYSEVEAQLKRLWSHSDPLATPESIYKGLDVEVKANGEAHVIAPN